IAAERVQVHLAERFAENAQVPFGRPQVAGDDARQRALAATVGAEDRGTRALLHRPRHVLEDPAAVAQKTHPVQLDRIAHAVTTDSTDCDGPSQPAQLTYCRPGNERVSSSAVIDVYDAA